MKGALRQTIRERLRRIPPAILAGASAQASALLEQQEVWRGARVILLYSPLPEEPDLRPLVRVALEEGRTVALPRFEAGSNRYAAARIQNLDRDLRIGKYGIREPDTGCSLIDLKRLDLILVPGVAFDLRGGRLGRGKGFYDQLLAHAGGTICGVAFDEQIVAELPVEPHDVLLNCILTPTRWIEP